MRNLITLNRGTLKPSVENFPDDLQFQLLDSVFDVVSDSITCVLGAMQEGMLEVQQYMKDGSKNTLASFNIETFGDKLLSFVHFAELNQLVFVLEQGDIIRAAYDPSSFDPQRTLVEIVGSIDNGIEAAAWSYDEELLALVTKDRNVVLLSKYFEPVGEYHLEITDLKMSKHVTVGWGKKETQFRGKGSRAMEREALASLKSSGLVGNELRDPTMPYMVDSGEITSLDTRQIEISWRGDCEYFAVSNIETVEDPDDSTKTIERRVIRVFTREGQLDSASEPVDGMEGCLAWKPQGALLASIQRNTNRGDENSLDLIFFERNGLRHGEFDTRLPLDEHIKALRWNSNSEILTIVLRDSIQLWTSKNYHWYLKQELRSSRVQFAKWHPEKEFTLMYAVDNSLNIVDFAHKMAQGPTKEPFDVGTSLVIDGSEVNITPLSLANVPPPVYFREFTAPGNVIDTATSLSNELFAAITYTGLVLASVTGVDAMKKGQHPSVICELPKFEFASEEDTLRQVAFIDDTIVGILIDSENLSRIALIDVKEASEPTVKKVVETFDKVILLRSSFEYTHLVYETRNASIVGLDVDGQMSVYTQFPELVCDFRVIRVHNHLGRNPEEFASEVSEIVSFGLTSSGKLFANNVQLASGVTSIEITQNLLLFTTAQHYLQFVHLNTTHFKPLPSVEPDVEDERVRAIERGSILVSVIPSKSSVVLQAPRGNLETIYPRIMVLYEVRKHIMARRYREAFIICRTHRIHLDILYDYAPELFLKNLETFIDQVADVDYLNLFISCLKDEDVTQTKYKETLDFGISDSFEVAPPPPTEMQEYIKRKFFDPSTSKINKICKAMLEVLLNREDYRQKYIQCILTAYATQKPQNLEDALRLIAEMRTPEEQDTSVTYLCFLQDVNLVYQVALSLYDVKLALLVAQKSQMDPNEYLPFLQNIYDNDVPRRKFIIDDYLGKHEKALEDLVEIGEGSSNLSDELIEYVEMHDLYTHALSCYRHAPESQNIIYKHFAKHLLSKQMYAEAGSIYSMLNENKEAMEAYISGKLWREALSLASSEFPDDIKRVSEELVSSLTFDHKYADAAQIQLEFLSNVEASMELYCKAYQFDSACLVASVKHRPELIEKIVDPGLGECFGTIAELLADCKGQVNSQLRRLRELRTKKREDPYAFYGQEGEQADDVSIAPSSASTKESYFTRYTGKTSGTAKTGASRRTAKNKRREERKRARGKKGTVYEEEYLIQSIGRLIDRLDQTQYDAVRLIDGMFRRNMREQAYQIQRNYVEILDILKEHVKEIYTIDEKDRERVDDNGEVYYVPEIPVPEIKDFPRRIFLDF